MVLDIEKSYIRKNNVLYEEGIPIIKFTFSRFIDVENMRIAGIKYMQRYIELYPNYCEKITSKEKQLTLF